MFSGPSDFVVQRAFGVVVPEHADVHRFSSGTQ
jgi:hypothetical protein